jgi:hypothetical protein
MKIIVNVPATHRAAIYNHLTFEVLEMFPGMVIVCPAEGKQIELYFGEFLIVSLKNTMKEAVLHMNEERTINSQNLVENLERYCEFHGLSLDNMSF